MATQKPFNASEVVGHPGPIPSERDRETLPEHQPGALGGGVAGERLIPTPIPIARETIDELERDGGGAASER